MLNILLFYFIVVNKLWVVININEQKHTRKHETTSSFKPKVKKENWARYISLLDEINTSSLSIFHSKLTLAKLTIYRLFYQVSMTCTGVAYYLYIKEREFQNLFSYATTVASQLLLQNPPSEGHIFFVVVYSAMAMSATTLTSSCVSIWLNFSPSTANSSCLPSWLKFPFSLNSWLWWCLQ